MKPFGNWDIRSYDEAEASALGYSPLVSALLCSRKLSNRDEAAEHLRDDLELLSDPMLMQDMGKAVERIRSALHMKEKIAIFGDYDVDGITSVCLMSLWLQSKGAECEVYIPERLTEGYGVSEDALRTIASDGSTLVITVDCGVTAGEHMEVAKQLNIDVVVTDHHQCPTTLPDAVAVVDPKRDDCPYPNKGLAGVGVVFKLICALEGPENTAKVLDTYGDLVAIGTIADMMPVTGENRAIIRHGINVLRRGERCGLRKLMDEAGLQFRDISGADLSFMLIPKLNAAGRMGQVMVAYDILMSRNDEVASLFAAKLCELNRERRNIENRVFNEICERLTHGNPERKLTYPIVVADGHWHNGVSGIVASRLADRFGVPAIVICWEDGVGRGSCRSFGNFSIFDALDYLKDDLISYGGHFHAAGLTLKHERLGSFIARLRSFYSEHKDANQPMMLPVDFAVTDMRLLSLENVERLADLSPWGTMNPPPILSLHGVKLDSITPIGSDKQHLKCRISKDRESFECVLFGTTPKDFNFRTGNYIDVAFEPIVNEFRGVRAVQLIVRDAKRQAMQRRQPRHTGGFSSGQSFDSAPDRLTMCRKFFSGAELTALERMLLKPERSDLVPLWKLIEGGAEDEAQPINAKLERLTRVAGIGNPGKTYMSLKIFEELGLIMMNESDGNLGIRSRCRKGETKVDLEHSDILAKLSA
ncbi:MAG: single-stranded-DNA-specific exonuclease RecJ [Oscillospiraceae bacterium]|jgi:single-stranded-DNA-specific exonuclease|nr:single-stranded-DNA-specific exonuclease RecJ [Oscillospiraceae bacterium]